MTADRQADVNTTFPGKQKTITALGKTANAEEPLCVYIV
jgi:hypothetical protein